MLNPNRPPNRPHKRPSPSRSTQPQSTRSLWAAGLNAALLAVLWLFESRVGEAFWLSGLLCYLPQHWVLLPTLALLALALRKRSWKAAGAYALTLGWATHVFLGLQIPAASTWSQAKAPGRTRIRVLSYNIVGGIGGIERVAATIREQKPDIICMQEAVVIAGGQDDPVGPLLRALPGYNQARAGEVCLFSRFPVLAQRQVQFPNGASRFVLDAVLDVRGVPIRVLVVHPYTITFRDPERSFPTRIKHSLRVRNAQVNTLLRAIDEPPSTWKPAWHQAPVLVAGDFNTPPRGRIYNALYERLGDSWREAGWGLGKTFSATLPVVRIDYVWHSEHWTARRAFVPNSRASDHRPIVVDLEL